MGQTFPLGTSNFRLLREDESLYVDKTHVIEQMEKDYRYITFLRPRRFGKSLLVSTLFYYYDIKSANLFENLFERLYIGQHSTKEKNSFYVLNLNFSDLFIGQNISIEESFKKIIIEQLENFVSYYVPIEKQQDFYKLFETDDPTNLIFKKTITNIAKLSENGKVYVLIDEYDHFTNRMIFSKYHNQYENAVEKSGYVRQFFTTLKSLTSGPVKRIFITGILPILLNDVTSGYNIDKKVSTDFRYQGAIGFTDSDVKMILKQENLSESDHFNRIKELYNGLNFTFNRKLVHSNIYNPLMVLNYIESIVLTENEPENIFDSNIMSDQNKFTYFMKHPTNIELIMDIMETNFTLGGYKSSLRTEDLLLPQNFPTVFFHFGMLSLGNKNQKSYEFLIPNLVTRILYNEYFKEYLQNKSPSFGKIKEITEITKELCQDGKIEPFIEFLEEELLSTFASRDTMNLSEQSLKFVLMMFFQFTEYYEIRSEYELVGSKKEGGFSDLLLVETRKHKNTPESQVNVEWLFELKYIKITNIKSQSKDGNTIKKQDVFIQNKVQKKLLEGKNQLQRYKNVYEEKYRLLNDKTEMKYAVILFVGKEFVFFEEI